MWGIIPAAGSGTRIQPLAFSKELLPVGSRVDARGVERPRAVSEYLLARMIRAGVDRVCFVISAAKHDIVQYYGGAYEGADIAYVVQDEPRGLCDAVFRACSLIPPDECVVIGLPDTVWFPDDALCALPRDRLALLLFRTDTPELFDSVETAPDETVRRISVKSAEPASAWNWGAMTMPGHVLHALHALWRRRDRHDEYLGTLINAYVMAGNAVAGVKAGEAYVDVGTLNGYRQAVHLLSGETVAECATMPALMARRMA